MEQDNQKTLRERPSFEGSATDPAMTENREPKERGPHFGRRRVAETPFRQGPDSANDPIVQAWNGVLFDKFTRFKHILTEGLSVHSRAWFAAHPAGKGQRIIDIGCGFGDTTIDLARAVGPEGFASGVDCAENFIRASINDAKETGVGNIEFFVADVQAEPLRGPYDAAFSRFGTMFFASPVAALRNVRRSLRPGATFTQIVWRKREDNPWLHAAEQRVRQIVPVVSHDQTDQVHCGPGPFSMAGPDMVSDILGSAGFEKIRFERFDADICIGQTVEEAVSFAMALGPAGEIIRLAGEEGQRRTAHVIEALRQVMEDFQRSDGSVWAPSSTWFVECRCPY
ncbi:MAG: class I SAM-dependent methyltransferase [Myxococcota bacterium]